jgi:tetratricopeptide (TPR) repeat protein
MIKINHSSLACIGINILLGLLLNSTAAWAYNYEPRNYYHATAKKEIMQIEHYHLNQGIEKFKQGKYEYAWSEFASILHYFPNHPKALQQLSDLSIQIEEPQRAVKYFERAISYFPNEAPTYEILGSFFYRLKNYNQAITQYKKGLALDQSNEECRYKLGLAKELAQFNNYTQQPTTHTNQLQLLPTP